MVCWTRAGLEKVDFKEFKEDPCLWLYSRSPNSLNTRGKCWIMVQSQGFDSGVILITQGVFGESLKTQTRNARANDTYQ